MKRVQRTRGKKIETQAVVVSCKSLMCERILGLVMSVVANTIMSLREVTLRDLLGYRDQQLSNCYCLRSARIQETSTQK